MATNTASNATTRAVDGSESPGEPTLTGLAFSDSGFDGQFLRVLDTIAAGGADVGELFSAATRVSVVDPGSPACPEHARYDSRVIRLPHESGHLVVIIQDCVTGWGAPGWGAVTRRWVRHPTPRRLTWAARASGHSSRLLG